MNRKTFIKNSAFAIAATPLLSISSFNSASKKSLEKLCATCGTQFPSHYTKEICAICDEERQYIPIGGQSWTTHEALLSTHKTKIIQLKEKIFEIVITPKFGIGQRAFLVVSKTGNVLWDCIPLLNNETIDFINSKGGLKAIAFSHPHYYSNMNDWAEKFDCPIYIHKYDEPYIHYKSKYIKLWKGDEHKLWDNMKLVNIGGHFGGSSIIMIPNHSSKATILCGDTLFLSLNKKHFSIQYSYANRIPLPLTEIRRINKRMNILDFDSIYGFLSYQNVSENAKKLVNESLSRYIV